MSDYHPSWKQFILEKYRPNTYGCGFRALARAFKVKGGARTVSDWYHAWEGTVESLKRKKGQGRKRKLSEEEVKQYILEPIRKKNRKTEPVQYRDVLAPLQDGTGKKVSLRTVQRIGKENAGINTERTQKKEKWEGRCHTHTST
jgi:transposase